MQDEIMKKKFKSSSFVFSFLNHITEYNGAASTNYNTLRRVKYAIRYFYWGKAISEVYKMKEV